MDGILGLGHFCETHGPCVIVCTQRCKEEPKQFSHNYTVPVCDSCQSLDLDQGIVSKDEHTCYVTTRTPLLQDLAFLLKQAVVRTLCCEESGTDGGFSYFGDNERGHVISHSFTLQDSLARGFHRKYCVLILMKDKIHLLNSWSFLTKNIKQITDDLKEKAVKVNNLEQTHRSQRAVRQEQGSPSKSGRSLGQLTGEPAVFAHIHLWFTWLLSAETVVEKPHQPPEVPADCNATALRKICKEMDEVSFRKILYCYLIGIKVDTTDKSLEENFKSLLPKKFTLPETGDVCRLSESREVTWNGTLPQKLPTLLTVIEKGLKDERLPDKALDYHITSLILRWHNIACVVSCAPNDRNADLLRSLGVQKHDMPLLSYWVPQCQVSQE